MYYQCDGHCIPGLFVSKVFSCTCTFMGRGQGTFLDRLVNLVIITLNLQPRLTTSWLTTVLHPYLLSPLHRRPQTPRPRGRRFPIHCSQQVSLLSVISCHTWGARAFSIAVPTNWNSLPKPPPLSTFIEIPKDYLIFVPLSLFLLFYLCCFVKPLPLSPLHYYFHH